MQVPYAGPKHFRKQVILEVMWERSTINVGNIENHTQLGLGLITDTKQGCHRRVASAPKAWP